MNRFSLASIEAGQAPVRFKLAWACKERFGVSLAWLARGTGNLLGNYTISKPILPSERMLFSDAFNLYIREALEYSRAVLHAFPSHEIVEATVAKGSALSTAELNPLFDQVKEHVAEAHWPSFLRSMENWAKDIANHIRKESGKGAVICKPLVDTASATDIVAGVRSKERVPSWKEIVAELKRLTDSPGAKAKLAEDLKTSRQNVNKWLNGEGAPSAELTLDVLRWVKEHGGCK